MNLIPAQYAYLFFSSLFIIPWWIFCFTRPDLRKEMLFMSVLIGISQPITQLLWWTKDWWHPSTITHTVVGIEDVILGFTNGGIAAVIYEEIWKKQFASSKGKRKNRTNHGYFSLIIILFAIIAVLFWGIGLTSFWASTFGLIFCSAILLHNRPDLLKDAFASGILMVCTVLPVYLLVIGTTPSFVNNTYHFNTLSRVLFFGIPIEELIFYFLFGFAGGPFYEYWQGLRLKKIKR